MALEPISIVIPSWNGAAILRRTLEHLARLQYADYEILVVDHGRLNRDTELLLNEFSGFSQIIYLGLDQQLGYAGAVNYGTSKAKHALVAVICNDVLVETDWLAELSKAYAEKSAGEKHPIATSLVTRPGFERALCHQLNIWGRIVDTNIRPASPENYIPFFPDGSAFLFDKNFYGAPFDSDYFLYQEDVSFGWRAWLMGEGVFLASRSKALNADGGTTRRTPHRAAYFTERNRWLNYFAFLSSDSFFRLFPALLLDAIVRLLLGSNRLAKLQAWAWLWLHPFEIIGKRRKAQKLRICSDTEIFQKISGLYMSNGKFVNALFLAYFKIVGLKFGSTIAH